MSRVMLLAALALAALLGSGLPAADAHDFTPEEAAAVREGLLEVLESAVTKAAAKADELDLPPSISESVRRVAFVSVDTVKEAKNIKVHNLASLRKSGLIGVDPITDGKVVPFTVPVELVNAYLTGDLLRRVNFVNSNSNFTTTIGVYRLEAEGTATVSRGACAFNFTAVKDIELNEVDTTVSGASVLNRVLAKEVSDGVRAGTVTIKEPVGKHILQALQESPQDCTASVRDHLAKAPSAPPPPPTAAAPAPPA